MQDIFFDISIMIIVATVFGYLAQLFRQPKIPAYILAGILLGPILHIVRNLSTIEILAEIGIAFLLFGVGLELDLKKLRSVGSISTIGSLIHIFLLFGLGVLLAYGIGYSNITAIYIGLILAFSSTMVVIKLLSDKNELDTLHGRIIIGMLLMQDIVAIIALSLINTFGQFSLIPILISIFQALIIIVFAGLCSKLIFPRLFRFAAHSGELLFLLSIAVCFVFALLFAQMGFSIIIGAFIAGVALGNLPYNVEIIGKIRPLKDFFGLLFFVAIGSELVFVNFSTIAKPLLYLTLFTVILVPIITIMVCSWFGFKRKTAFMTGISMAQVSEFSLIIVFQGKSLGHLSNEIVALTIWLTLITMGLTAYLLKYDDFFYRKLERYLKLFEIVGKPEKKFSHNIQANIKYQIALIGYDRMGYNIFKSLTKMGKSIIIVDINPEIIKKLSTVKIPCMYGDAGDPEFLDRLDLQDKELVISTNPNYNDNLLLVKKVKQENKNSNVFVTALLVEEALGLYDSGADYVMIPHYLGGEHASLIIQDISFDFDKMIRRKIEHISALKDRKERHPHHK
ncbi:MAG: cation:proton antiporter [Nanoarchaeota archaeon]